MSTELPPDWAIERALEQGYRGNGWTAKVVKTYGSNTPLIETVLSFARYIAEHEDAPVDPVILEARKIGADLGWYQANSIGLLHDGMFDNCGTMQGLIAALRRGIELGKSS